MASMEFEVSKNFIHEFDLTASDRVLPSANIYKPPSGTPLVSDVDRPINIYRTVKQTSKQLQERLKELDQHPEKIREQPRHADEGTKKKIYDKEPQTLWPEAFAASLPYGRLLENAQVSPSIDALIVMQCKVQGIPCDVTFCAAKEIVKLEKGKERIDYEIQRMDVRPEALGLRDCLGRWVLEYAGSFSLLDTAVAYSEECEEDFREELAAVLEDFAKINATPDTSTLDTAIPGTAITKDKKRDKFRARLKQVFRHHKGSSSSSA